MPEIISGNRVLKKHSLGTPYMNSEKERSLYRSDIMSKDNSIILKYLFGFPVKEQSKDGESTIHSVHSYFYLFRKKDNSSPGQNNPFVETKLRVLLRANKDPLLPYNLLTKCPTVSYFNRCSPSKDSPIKDGPKTTFKYYRRKVRKEKMELLKCYSYKMLQN